MSWCTGGQMLNHWRSAKTRFSRVLSYSLICIFICPSFLMFWCIIFLQTLVEIQQIMCDLLQINTTTSFILWSCDKIKQSAANLKEFTVDPSKHSAANSLHEEESHTWVLIMEAFFFFKKKFCFGGQRTSPSLYVRYDCDTLTDLSCSATSYKALFFGEMWLLHLTWALMHAAFFQEAMFVTVEPGDEIQCLKWNVLWCCGFFRFVSLFF